MKRVKFLSADSILISKDKRLIRFDGPQQNSFK